VPLGPPELEYGHWRATVEMIEEQLEVHLGLVPRSVPEVIRDLVDRHIFNITEGQVTLRGEIDYKGVPISCNCVCRLLQVPSPPRPDRYIVESTLVVDGNLVDLVFANSAQESPHPGQRLFLENPEKKESRRALVDALERKLAEYYRYLGPLTSEPRSRPSLLTV
jgi:hypothetical protein